MFELAITLAILGVGIFGVLMVVVFWIGFSIVLWNSW
jgi:hypothetical protein